MRRVAYRIAVQSTDRTVGLRPTYKRAKRFAEKRAKAVPVKLAISRVALWANFAEVVQHIESAKESA